MDKTLIFENTHYHALDNLRALMMRLGVVIHSAMPYMEPSIPSHE